MEIQEVKNAYAAYGKFSEIEPYEFVLIHPFTDDHVIIRTKLEKPSKIKGLALI